MSSKISFWLAAIGFLYPLVLLARLTLFFPPPWWLFEYSVFTCIVLPIFFGVALLFAKLNGAKMGWVTVPAFPLWISVVNWVYAWVLGEIAAGC